MTVYILDTAWTKVIIEKLSQYLYRVAYRRTILTMNHDRMKKCTDQSEVVASAPGKVYCLCRKPDDGTLMIQCDKCDHWYHGACVGVTETDGIEQVKWFCPLCSKVSH